MPRPPVHSIAPLVLLLAPGLVAAADPPPGPAAPSAPAASDVMPRTPPTVPRIEDLPANAAPIGAGGAPATCTPGGCDLACDGLEKDEGWLCEFLDRQEPLLADHRNVPLFDDPGCCNDSTWYYSVGGEFRYRYLDERNRLRPQGTDRPSNYHQTRFTPFVEIGNDWIKGYARGIDAQTTGNDIPIVAIDRNRWDMMEYYLDAKVGEIDGAPLRFRYGRQILQYGDQHLISPLAWANTFRTFAGSRLYYADDVWDIDAFAVQPVNGSARGVVFKPESFDTNDESNWLSGVYATYKDAPKGKVDLYWIWSNENEPQVDLQNGDRHTIGSRYYGKHAITECDEAVRTYFWNLQGGYQFGRDNFGGPEQDVRAGFVNATSGVTFDNVAWKPTFTGLFWYGTGDDDPNDGVDNTYYSLYPLGHAYWGLIDNFDGQNLIDYSVQGSVQPTEKVNFAAAWHWFDKAQRNDAIYNIVGAPLGPAGTDANIGNELDLVATYQANPNLQFQAGYFMFWYGDAVNQTALNRPDAKQFYFMTTLGF